MPAGLVRSGNFLHGTPIVLPHVFGNLCGSPEPFGNVIPQSNATLDSNPVTWIPGGTHFGNMVGFSLQVVAPIVIASEGTTGTTNIVVTDIGAFTGAVTLSYSGAPSGVTVAFSPNPDTGTSVATITVGASVPNGKYTITVTGTSGSITETTNIHLVVTGTGAPASYSISGTISGAIASGVSVALTGTSSASTTTGTGGTYSFSGLSNGSYTVTPSLAGYSFAPTSHGETVSGGNITGVNFTSTALLPALIASGLASIAPVGPNPLTLNTTGANFLVAVLGYYHGGAPAGSATMQDGFNNTWVELTPQSGTNVDTAVIAYVQNPTVGYGHTFTFNTTGTPFCWAVVYAFSNMATSSVYDGNQNGGTFTSPFQPGSITPAAGDVVITGFSTDHGISAATINSGFATPTVQSNNANETGAASYLIGASGSAINPTWDTTPSGTSNLNSVIASFKPI